MELKELTTKTLRLFDVTDVEKLGGALLECATSFDKAKMDSFCQMVGNDLSKDWLQMIYQYYLAEREQKKQDYTPKCLALLLSRLIGESDTTIDMCSGSGALTIQRWNEYPDMDFELYEYDENVIPYLVFNMAVRNIKAVIHQSDVLQQEIINSWIVQKGAKYGQVVNIKSSV
ncbi:MAG: N-6 DNA methylase [Ruminococcus sp.]|nr:N-6 DNA methylase [Ruminococcus sp.]